jgi:two-component system phosphate regulon sensor histidine kinase PhoR
MKNPLYKIVIILIAVIFIPMLFFTVYEISSLNQSEEVLNQIYSNQLDAILFSINQYSEDVVSSWRNKINNSHSVEEDELINAFLNTYGPVNYLFITDSLDSKNLKIYSKKNPTGKERSLISELLASKENIIKRLYTYKKSGYLKLEPVEISPGNSSVLFLLDDNSLCGVIFNPVTFINQLLNSKMRSIAGNEFVLAVYKPRDNNIVLSTDQVNIGDLRQTKPLWLLPEYNLGITLKGKTIEELVKARTTQNLILIAGITLLIIIGIWLVFRNIKKEIQLAQIKSDFVSNVSHELRTPLSLISMFAETLELGRVKSEEKKNEYYSILHSETNRLSNIVNKVLNFSKMEAGKRTFRFERSDLNEITENIFNTYSFHLQNNGFEFYFKPGSDLPSINIDPEAISEAIINLIDNAVKYSDDNKVIILRTGKDNGFAFVEVEDRGIGISESDQKKIFEKFFRVSTGYVHNTKGTGLGLSLVKQIVHAHKGKISLTSAPGKGSRFRLLFSVS